MASACVKNNIGMSPESFLDCPASFPSYGWLNPRISLSRELPDNDVSGTTAVLPSSQSPAGDAPELADPDVSGNDVVDFEFRLEDPVAMLPADELFYDGKLVPLQVSLIRPAETTAGLSEIRSPDAPKSRRRGEISAADPYLFSPKAPRCSSRWKEILGLKRLYQTNNAKHDSPKTGSSLSSSNSKLLKHFLHRSSKSLNSSLDSSLSLPLLKDTDNESVSISSRLSLSSSSSGHDHDDLPRLSLDSDKTTISHNSISLNRNPNQSSHPRRLRVVKSRTLSSETPATTRVGRSQMRPASDSTTTTGRGVSVDSPRMNSSGKIVFHSLERSSSSPSSYGGPRFKQRGMERSYSANVRVTPVLNVPVCSLRGSSKSGVFGFPLFSAPQKREGSNTGSHGGGNKLSSQGVGSKNRLDRA